MLGKDYLHGSVRFSVEGDIGLTDIADFLREMRKEMISGNRFFVLDISPAKHIQRHAFDSLVNIKNKLRAGGVRLVIVCSKQSLLDILKVERVLEHFEVYKDPQSLYRDYAFAKDVQHLRR